MGWSSKFVVVVGVLALVTSGSTVKGQAASDADRATKPAAESAPLIYQSDGVDLLAAREAFRAGDKQTVKTVESIIKEAQAHLNLAPLTVVGKKGLPPSGDKHDYMSLSPYWWPDPNKPDGKPYIRRDGEFNPERQDYDLAPLDKLSNAVEQLSLAYFFTGDEEYAQKTAELIRTWFIDPSTRMNPNLKYAQFVPGYEKPRPSGIIEGGRFRDVIDAPGLLAGSQHWTPEDDAALRSWFKDLVTYITTSEQGKAEIRQRNNHGTWVHVQLASYAMFTGQDDLARKLLATYKELIDNQIRLGGTQPEELARTDSFHYSRYNLVGLQDLAMLGDRYGMDLWNHQTEDGRSMRLAIDYLLPFTLQEKQWPHQQLRPPKYADMIPVLRRAANAFNEPKYESAVKKLQEEQKRVMTELLFPSKVQ